MFQEEKKKSLQDSKGKPSPHSTHLLKYFFLLDFSGNLNATASVEKNKWHGRINKEHRGGQQKTDCSIKRMYP